MSHTHALPALAGELVRHYGLTAADLVLEVGSGDGEFLKAVRALGPRVLGVEPDVMVMNTAWGAKVDTLAAHFGAGVADYVRSRYGPARVVFTRAAAADELPRLVAAACRCLAPGGVVVMQPAAVNALVEVRPDPPVALSRAA